MAIQPQKYVRKPFEVEAVEVTEANMADVAAWCGGTIDTDPEAPRGKVDQKFIKVQVKKPLSERQTRAYSGDWVLLALTNDRDAGPAGFKVYTPKAFTSSFQKQIDEMIETVTRMDERAKREDVAEEQGELQFSDIQP